jgi:hypothetical protein
MGESTLCYVWPEELLELFELSKSRHDEMPAGMEHSLKAKQWGKFRVS